jgi:hypothetical protein
VSTAARVAVLLAEIFFIFIAKAQNRYRKYTAAAATLETAVFAVAAGSSPVFER